MENESHTGHGTLQWGHWGAMRSESQIKNSLRNFLHTHSSPPKEKDSHSQFSKNRNSANHGEPMREHHVPILQELRMG